MRGGVQAPVGIQVVEPESRFATNKPSNELSGTEEHSEAVGALADQ